MKRHLRKLDRHTWELQWRAARSKRQRTAPTCGETDLPKFSSLFVCLHLLVCSWTMLRLFPCSEAAIKLETLQIYIPAALVRDRLRRGRAFRQKQTAWDRKPALLHRHRSCLLAAVGRDRNKYTKNFFLIGIFQICQNCIQYTGMRTVY